MVSPRTGSRWASLSTTGVALPPSTLRSSTAPRAGQREAQLARVGVEADGLAAAAVERRRARGRERRRRRAAREPSASRLRDIEFCASSIGHRKPEDSSNPPSLRIGALRLRSVDR